MIYVSLTLDFILSYYLPEICAILVLDRILRGLHVLLGKVGFANLHVAVHWGLICRPALCLIRHRVISNCAGLFLFKDLNGPIANNLLWDPVNRQFLS